MQCLADGLTPDDLITRARMGDESARGILLETYRDYLGLLAQVEIGRTLQTKLDTSDLVQDTFLEAFSNFERFRGTHEAEFTAWLRSILAAKTHNLIRHYWGTQGRDVRREQRLDIDFDQSSCLIDRALFAAESTPSKQVAQKERGLRLAQALRQLPEDYCEVVVLRNLEALSFSEVALRMNRSVDSVQKIWVRALVRLRQLMKDFDD
jgi:RNA polymerase sigma-70 factor, ECF subfamily